VDVWTGDEHPGAGLPAGRLADAPANLDSYKRTRALQIPISQQGTPNLNRLPRRTLLDAGLAIYAAKTKYTRQRPFVVEKESTSSLGWAWALVRAQAAPQRMDALLQRGYAFGQSRVICSVHWQRDKTVNAQVALAREKIAQAKGQKPPVDCAAEATALRQ